MKYTFLVAGHKVKIFKQMLETIKKFFIVQEHDTIQLVVSVDSNQLVDFNTQIYDFDICIHRKNHNNWTSRLLHCWEMADKDADWYIKWRPDLLLNKTFDTTNVELSLDKVNVRKRLWKSEKIPDDQAFIMSNTIAKKVFGIETNPDAKMKMGGKGFPSSEAKWAVNNYLKKDVQYIPTLHGYLKTTLPLTRWGKYSKYMYAK